jgi:hypothetical protein
MIEHNALTLIQAFTQLEIIIQGLYQYPELRIEMRADEKDRIARSSAFVWIEAHRNVLTDDDLHLRIWALRNGLSGNNPYSAEALIHELEGIRNQLALVVSKRKFAYIPSSVEKYFEQDKLFGDSVYNLIPEARQDIKEAGNCIAASLYNASIFHLMRASEYGLRKLGRRVRVRLSHKGKPQPLDTATWDKVINAVKAKLQSGHAMNYGAARAEKIRFLSDLADRCSFIKDLWRNDVMHTRGSYDLHDSLAAFERVKGFMQLLCQL